VFSGAIAAVVSPLFSPGGGLGTADEPVENAFRPHPQGLAQQQRGVCGGERLRNGSLRQTLGSRLCRSEEARKRHPGGWGAPSLGDWEEESSSGGDQAQPLVSLVQEEAASAAWRSTFQTPPSLFGEARRRRNQESEAAPPTNPRHPKHHGSHDEWPDCLLHEIPHSDGTAAATRPAKVEDAATGITTKRAKPPAFGSIQAQRP